MGGGRQTRRCGRNVGGANSPLGVDAIEKAAGIFDAAM